MTGTQNKEINGEELNNIRPTESDIKSLNLNDNIEDRYKSNCKGFRAAVPLKMQKRWPLSYKKLTCDYCQL